MDKVNKHIQRTFGEVLASEAILPREAMVTVTAADTTRNLRSTTVWLSVLPTEYGGRVLEMLSSDIYELQGAFNRAVHMKPLPRIRLCLDHGAEHAEHIGRKLANIQHEN